VKRSHEEGAALLTVLLMVAVIAALTTSVLDDIRFALKRASNAESVGQAQWYALGTEALTRTQLMRLADAKADQIFIKNSAQTIAFPIEHGAIRARIEDAGLCFNLNSVVEGVPEQWSRRDTGVRQFIALMEALGVQVNEAEQAAESLADWIDSDIVRSTSGAEDESYAGLARPYRTSGTLLADVSELRVVNGITPDMFASLRPYICALPTAELSSININRLDEGRAELLTAITEGKLSIAAAKRLIASRPALGWRSVESFWNLESLKDALPSNDALSQLSLRSRFFRLFAEVDYAGGEAVLTTLFEQPAGGSARLIARHWGGDQ